MHVKLNKKKVDCKIICKAVIDKILNDIKRGGTIRHSAESNGVSNVLFHNWVRQGLLDNDYDVDSLHSFLVKSLRKIQLDKIISLKNLLLDSEKSHKGAEFILERSYWRDFSLSAPILEMSEKMEEMEYKISNKVADQ